VVNRQAGSVGAGELVEELYAPLKIQRCEIERGVGERVGETKEASVRQTADDWPRGDGLRGWINVFRTRLRTDREKIAGTAIYDLLK
jgi:hypothetical protein